MFDVYVYTAVGDADKHINKDRINHVLVFENQLEKLFNQLKIK